MKKKKKLMITAGSVVFVFIVGILTTIFSGALVFDQTLEIEAVLSGYNDGQSMVWSQDNDVFIPMNRNTYYSFNIGDISSYLTQGKVIKKAELLLQVKESEGNSMIDINKMSSQIYDSYSNVSQMPSVVYDNGWATAYGMESLSGAGLSPNNRKIAIELDKSLIQTGNLSLRLRGEYNGTYPVTRFYGYLSNYKPKLKITFGKPDPAPGPAQTEFTALVTGYNDDANMVYSTDDMCILASQNDIGTTNGARAGFMKFDLSATINRAVKSVKLVFEVGSRGSQNYSVDVRLLEDADFNENTNSFSNMPDITDQVLSRGNFTGFLNNENNQLLGEINLNKNILLSDEVGIAILPSEGVTSGGDIGIYGLRAPSGHLKPKLVVEYESETTVQEDENMESFYVIDDMFAGILPDELQTQDPQYNRPILNVRKVDPNVRLSVTYLKFDISKVDMSRVKEMKLQLQHCPQTPGIDFSMDISMSHQPQWQIRKTDNGWGEYNPCVSNHNGTLVGSASGSQMFSENGQIKRFNIDKNLIDAGVISFAIKDVSPLDNNISVYSKEAEMAGIGLAPRLLVYYNASSAPQTDFAVTEDTFSFSDGTSGQETATHGAQKVNYVRKNETAPRYATTFMKFDLRNLNKQDVKSVKLRIQQANMNGVSYSAAASSIQNAEIEIFKVERSWFESTLTYRNMPGISGETIGTVSGTSFFTENDQIIEIPLDIAQITDTVLSIGIKDASDLDNQISFWSKEGAAEYSKTPPTIVVEYHDTVTRFLTPTDDSTIRNFGGEPDMTLRGLMPYLNTYETGGNGDQRMIMMKFDISTLQNRQAVSAKLKLYTSEYFSEDVHTDIDFVIFNSSDWSEYTVSGLNAPSVLSYVDYQCVTTNRKTLGQEITFSINPNLLTGNYITLGIITLSGMPHINIYSKEAPSPEFSPILEITDKKV